MSIPQKLLTVAQVRTMRPRSKIYSPSATPGLFSQDSDVEFVTRDALVQPDRYTFADIDELTAYLSQVLGGQPEGRGIRGSMSRKV
jgi:hypothetical protein